MVSEREVKRVIAEVLPNRQFKAEAREAIARRTQQFMTEFIRSVANYTKTDSERISENHVTLAWAYYNDALEWLVVSQYKHASTVMEDETNADE